MVYVTPASQNLPDLAGALTVRGGMGGTTGLVFDDQQDPLNETYTLTPTTFASTHSALVTYSNAQSIAVNGGLGNNPLVVDSSNGLVTVPGGIQYDGGAGFNSLQLVQTGGDTQTSDVYGVGPGTGMGTSTITGPSGTQAVYFQNLAPVTDLVPATTLTVNGTSANNTIGYSQGPNSGTMAVTSATTGQVAIDNFEPIEFANKANLAINTSTGTDTVGLKDASTPTGLTAISVTGGDPNANDALIVNGVAPTVAVNTGTRTITGATGAGGAVPITFNTIAALTVNAGSSTTLAVSGSPSYVYTPGAANDAGTIQTNTLPISFTGFGTGASLALTGSGPAASLVANGTTGNDTFVVNTSALGGQVTLNSRAPILTANIPTATLKGVAGDDTFTLVPTIAAHPYTTLNLQGGPPASPMGSQANLTAAAAADVAVSGQTVSQGGKAVVGSGLANINLNGAGNRLIYNGVAGVTEKVNVLASPTANQGQLSVPGVAQLTFTNVPSVDVNGNAADSDTLTFTGTNNADTFRINLAAAGTDSDPVLKLLNAAAATLLTLRNYTGFSTLNVKGLDGADTFNVYTAPTAPGGGRNLFIDGTLPSGKKKGTDVLNVFYVRPRPKIVQSAATQNPSSGLVSLDYGTGFAFYLIQYAGIGNVVISQK
jgi:hypothetical protein